LNFETISASDVASNLVSGFDCWFCTLWSTVEQYGRLS